MCSYVSLRNCDRAVAKAGQQALELLRVAGGVAPRGLLELRPHAPARLGFRGGPRVQIGDSRDQRRTVHVFPKKPVELIALAQELTL